MQRILSLERSFIQNGRFLQFDDVVWEYLDLGHAEGIPS